MGWHLRDLLGDRLYEAQKEAGKMILGEAKDLSKDLTEDVYVLQKKVLAEAQEAIVIRVKNEAKKKIDKGFDKILKKIRKVFIVGPILAKIAAKYKDELLNLL